MNKAELLFIVRLTTVKISFSKKYVSLLLKAVEVANKKLNRMNVIFLFIMCI